MSLDKGDGVLSTRLGREWKRWLCAGMSAVFLLSTAGCGLAQGEGAQTEVSQSVETGTDGSQQGSENDEGSSVSVQDGSEASGEQGKADEDPNKKGEVIYDFYDYVNEDWIKSQDSKAYSYVYDTDEIVKERLAALLDQIDVNALDPQEDLYKVAYLYHQLTDTEYREKYGNAKFKKFLDRIDKVKNLKELCALYQEEDYEKYNALISYQIVPNVNIYNYPIISPSTIWNRHQLKDEALAQVQEMLECLGFSQKRAMEIVQNAKEMDDMIYESCVKDVWESGITYMYQEQLDNYGVELPVVDILKKTGANNEWEGFMASFNIFDFWKKTYREENAPKLRDHLLVVALVANSDVMGDTKIMGLGREFSRIQFGDLPCTENDLMINFLAAAAEDTLADLYCKAYLDEEIIPFAEELSKSISTDMRNLIGELSWITIDGEQLLKNKMFYAKKNFGRNVECMDLSGIRLSEDLVDNILAFRRNRAQFAKEQLKKEKTRKTFLTYVLDTNGVYYAGYNAYTIGAGYMSMDMNRSDAAYEERLAGIGFCLAHEMTHAFDPSGILVDEGGYSYDWMRDGEKEKYSEYYLKLVNFLNGQKDKEGKPFDGTKCESEYFADLTAMGICLRELGKKENPDYDLFFRSYARVMAESEEYSKYMETSMGGHLPGRYRVNLVLGNFKEFYDTYNIAEDGPSYIPEEQRLPLF